MVKPVFFLENRDSAADIVIPKEDGLRTNGSKGWFEWWYFDANLDDNSTVVIVFSTKSLLGRKGSLNPGVSLTISHPNGQKLSRFSRFPAQQFYASENACDVRIGINHAVGDLRNYRVKVNMGDLAAELTFHSLVSPWRPGSGKINFDNSNRVFGWLPSFPCGAVEESLTIDGQSHNVRGIGYHDHNWGNVDLHKVMDRWIWGHAHIEGYTLIFAELITSKTYNSQHIPVFMMAKGKQLITGDGNKLNLGTHDFIHHYGGKEYPRKLNFLWQDGSETIRLTLDQPQILDAVSRLGSFPAWQRGIIRLFANPYYFRFKARLELAINTKVIRAAGSGFAIYEMIFFK